MIVQNNAKAPGSAWKTMLECLILTSIFCLFATATENALAEWQLDPILRLGWDYDDNATLSIRTDAEEQISGIIGEASADFAYDSETGFFSLRPMFRSRNYGSETNRDSDDQFLRLRTGYDGQVNSLGFFADYSRESVRTAELADADLDTDIGPDLIPDDDTGRIGIRERRERLRVLPQWSLRLSNVSSIEAGINFLTVDYVEKQQVTNLFDYTDARLRLSYRRNFSAKNTGIVTLSARDYETEKFGGDRTGYGISTGFIRALSATTRFRALFGIEETEQEDIGQATVISDPNFVTDISLTRRLETIRLLAQYRQRVAASGRGELTRRNEFNLRFTRDLNDKISAGLGVRAYTVDSVDGSTNEQDYVQLRGQFIWRITSAFSMQADYRYTILDREFLGEGANSNRVTVWLSYQPNPRRRAPQVILR